MSHPVTGIKLLRSLQKKKVLPTDNAYAVLVLMHRGAKLWRSTTWESSWWMTDHGPSAVVHEKVASSLLRGEWIKPGASDKSGRREHTITMKGKAALADLRRINLEEDDG